MRSTLIGIFFLLPVIIFGQLTFTNLSSKSIDDKELFIGAENYIEVSGINYKANKLAFNISHGKLTKVGGNKYLVKVSIEKPDTLRFYQDNKLSLVEVFSVKQISSPIAQLANSNDTLLSVSQIKINPFLTVVLPECNYKHNFQIISFRTKIIYSLSDETLAFETTNGNYIPKELLQSIEKLNRNDKIVFETITATCPDCRNVRLPNLVIIIK